MTFFGAGYHRQFQHALMICEILASIELASRMVPGLRFVGWPEILARAPETTRVSPVPFRLPLSGDRCMTPDGMFGLEYEVTGSKTYRFVALDADRGTMPILRGDKRQSSVMGKLVVYRRIIAERRFKDFWGLPNLLVVTVLTSQARLDELVGRAKCSTPSHAFLFKAIEERELRTPMPGLLFAPWQRVGDAPLKIDESN